MRFAGAPQVAAFLSDRPDYGNIADLGLKARSKERQTATVAEARTHMAKLDAMAEVRAAEHRARGIEAGGQAQAAATRANGISGMIGSIAGGIGKLDFGGGGFSNNNDPGTFGTSFGVGQIDYSHNANPSQYAPGSISSPGWTWANSGIG